MAETTQRVQRWRQRLKDEGKEALTIYLAHDEKLRLEDWAHTWHCSPSALVQQALAAFNPGSPAVPGPAADTAQVRALIREALAHLRPFEGSAAVVRHEPQALVTATFSNVAAPQTDALPPLDPPARDADSAECDYDKSKFMLGKLCPGRHEYQHTGQSLLTIKGRRCYPCENAKHRAKRPPRPDYDPARFHLGPLCNKPGHAYQETGQSLRTPHARCRVCLNEANERSRQRKKQPASAPIQAPA
jgi:hypothetical protein